MNKKELRFEKEWNKKYIQINLEHEIYPNDTVEKNFFIITPKELKELMHRTKRRVREYNEIKPRKWAEYE